MSRDLWQVKRGIVQTKKMRKYLEIPAFTYNCWYPRRALKSVINPTGTFYQTFISTFYNSAFTLEFWAYSEYVNESTSEVFLAIVGAGTGNVYLVVSRDSEYIITRVLKTAVVQSISSTAKMPIRQWFHVAVTYNGTTLKLYLDGKLQGSHIVSAPLDSEADGDFYLYSYSGGQTYYGYLDEIRMFDYAKTLDELLFFMDKHYYINDANLMFYYNMDNATDDGALVTIPNEGLITGQITRTSGLQVELVTDNTPLIVLGASFVVAEFATSLGRKCSLKYPVAMPDDAENFGLFASWVDDNGDLQRRKLFAPDGIKLAPNPIDYAGERMSDGFKFEIINVDGEDHVTLGSTLTLEISHTSNPTGGTDHAQLEAQDLTADTTLAEDYPLGGGSLTFNTQQTY